MDEQISTAAEVYEAAVLPRCYEAHADPARCGNAALPEAVTEKPVNQKSPAQWAYERIVVYLKRFEEQLDSEQEVAMGFSGADAGILRIEGMGYFDPDIVTFYGSDSAGGRMQHIQHVSQLNVILRALPKAQEHAEPERIGFRLVEELKAEAAADEG